MRTKSATKLLVSIQYSLVITSKLYLTCTTVHVNIYTTCILILVRSSCTQEHHESYLWNVSGHASDHECFCKLRHELYCIYKEDIKSCLYLYVYIGNLYYAVSYMATGAKFHQTINAGFINCCMCTHMTRHMYKCWK